jgi:hypothetical protein
VIFHLKNARVFKERFFMKFTAKKITAVIAAAAVVAAGLIGFVSCDSLKNAVSGVPELDVPFTAEAAIEGENLSLTANIKRLGTGLWEMEITSPESLRGLKINYSEDKIASIYDGIITETPIEKLSEEAIFLQLFGAVDNAANLETPDVTEADGDYFINGQIPATDYRIQIDGTTKQIEEIALEDTGYNCVITNFAPIQ